MRVMKFPLREYNLNYLCSFVGVFYYIVRAAEGRKKIRTETQRSKGKRGQNRADTSSRWNDQLRLGWQLEPLLFIFPRSHPLFLPSSFLLFLAVNSLCLHLSFFPLILFPLVKKQWAFCFNHTPNISADIPAHTPISGLQLLQFSVSFLFLHPAEEGGTESVGRSKLRQIGMAKCPVGQVCLRLFTADSLQEARISACLKKMPSSVSAPRFDISVCVRGNGSLLEDNFSWQWSDTISYENSKYPEEGRWANRL